MTPTRREFVTRVARASAAASLGATIVPRHVLGGPGWQAPSDTVNVAIVGAGGMGAANARELLSQNIIAICDVDFSYVEANLRDRQKHDDPVQAEKWRRVAEVYHGAKRYADFRIMLEEEPAIDAVVIATPDHTHAVIAQRAMEMGKHVYVQKPLTWSIHESRVLLETARRTGVVTQMGNQGRSSVEAARIQEWLRSGAIGDVREVHAWTNRPIWPQGMPHPATPAAIREQVAAARSDGDDGFMSWHDFDRTLGLAMGVPVRGGDPYRARGSEWRVPDSLDWDLFLGPVPHIPYHPIYHPFNWRGWVPFGVGALGDMGAHLLDHPYESLELGYPDAVEATGSAWGGDARDPASYPAATMVHYRYPAAGSRPPVALTWYDGGLMPPRHALIPDDFEFHRAGAVVYVGDRGILTHANRGSDPRLFPRELEQQYGPAPRTDMEVGYEHEMNWIRAIRGEESTTSPFEAAAPLTENMLLGLVALRTGYGKVIRYDPGTMSVTNAPGSNRYLHRDYREGWTL